MKDIFLGADVGSITTNIVVLNEQKRILDTVYLRNNGYPISAIQQGLRSISHFAEDGFHITGAGVTGSGRHIAAEIIGADLVKNEITAHAVGALDFKKDCRTVIEIGGQDSKLIIIRDGVVVDFAMNTICAAGTGSFLDQQSLRLGITIDELSELSIKSSCPSRIMGRCGIFAESDMIYKQQMGHTKEDIIAGLCETLAKNYLNNVAAGKRIEPPVLFQGGVAANKGMKKAFEKILGLDIIVPEHFSFRGAIGVALLTTESAKDIKKSRFKGFKISNLHFNTKMQICDDCSESCEVIHIFENKDRIATLGSRCGKWQR